MPHTFCYEYPRPSVTVDLAVFAMRGDTLVVLLVRRKAEPNAGRWALPGGFLNIDEPAEVGARRELREETGLDLPGPVRAFGFFDAPGRDPRGRTISLAHAVAIRGPIPEVAGGDDAAGAAWVDALKLGSLAFDHEAILNRAFAWLREGVEDGPVGQALLPREFVAAQAKVVLRTILGPDASVRTWLRRQEVEGRLAPLGGNPSRYRTRGG